jgi:hypothetical protein
MTGAERELLKVIQVAKDLYESLKVAREIQEWAEWNGFRNPRQIEATDKALANAKLLLQLEDEVTT